ncbi:MAG: WecB/TagA/CpsF family glycosyltransferase [Roseateles sp.]|uniref:WecB/TagA/CpsF family glycosyltransferase n=1 Tax=Roseateles sp. TaxID=1971397 RepID=UPI0039EAB3B4
MVVTVNADFIVTAHKNPRFARIINENASTFDGQVPFVLARHFAQPRDTPIEKISGSDLVPELLASAARQGRRVLLLGAAADSNAEATRIARERYGAQVEGYSPPLAAYPFPNDWRDACRHRIDAFRPHYIFVALGAPKQEFWMDDEQDWLADRGVELCIGCGGSLDFLSGEIRRAPRWVQRAGLEGVYRTLSEPKLFRLKRLLRSFLVFRYLWR